jgi:DNA-binding transcriptional MerR regulator
LSFIGTQLSDEAPYTLGDLADAFGLTERTARHYVEKILPPGHRTGRGRRARYGRDTWNCFAFIHRARRDGLTLAQITALLKHFDPPNIERVARGFESLSIVAVAADEPAELYSSPCMSGDFPDSGDETSAAARADRWQLLYADDRLQIAHCGRASPEQRTQVRLAAAYIKRLLGHA